MSRQRDSRREERERIRFQVLKGLYELGWPQREQPVRAVEVGSKLGISREALFRAVLELTHRHFLRFCAAGPKVRVTEEGAAYIEQGAGRRKSIRDE